MVETKLDLAELEKCAWRELRTELVEWDDYGDGVVGFDGLTRFWCQEAVFEIYWTAEKTGFKEYKIYLTEDLELAGFKAKLAFNPSLQIKQELAEAIAWQKVAQSALKKASGRSLELVKE